MFFMRLRRSAKPVFMLLAVVFALSFVFLGVGSGSSGIGDLLRGDFSIFGRGGGGSSGPSVGKAQAKIAKNPNDAAAYRELATAYETKNQVDSAIGALEGYTRLKPKDVDALRELAALYLRKADQATQRLQVAQAATASAPSITSLAPPASDKLTQALQDPIAQAVSTKANAAFSAAYSNQQAAYSKALGVYRQIGDARPNDPTVQLELAQAAEAAGANSDAVAAYQRFLKLAPDDPSAAAIKQRIKQLQSQTSAPSSAGG
jgi:tetratricopeptide (TPR) repeat protein